MRTYVLLIFTLFTLSLNAEVRIAQLKYAEAKFKQTRTSQVLTNPVVQMGSFAFVAPDSICWKYDGLDKVQLPEQMLSFIRLSISGDLNATKGVFVTQWQGNILILTPIKKQISKFFKNIEIYFNHNGIAKMVTLEEPSGDRTQIEFINMKFTIL